MAVRNILLCRDLLLRNVAALMKDQEADFILVIKGLQKKKLNDILSGFVCLFVCFVGHLSSKNNPHKS